MMERYLRRLVVYCLILGTTFIFFLVIRHVSIEQGGKKTKLQETKVERRSKAKQPPKISESGKKGNELTSIGDATGVQRTFDVRKMCGKICDRTQHTCFPPELTIFIYGNVQSKYMMFEQNFRKWKSREEKFSSKRKFCPVNEIDSSFETLTRQKKCAIIGNSGILLDSKCGEEIDSHDYVLRANLAETDGYSEDVGNKTTLMMINVEMTTKIYNDTIFPDNGTVYDAILKNLRILNDSIIWYSKGVPAGSPYSKQLHDIATYVKRKGLNTRFAFSYMSAGAVAKKKYKFTGSYPSSGLIMLMVAETFCKEITLYGFYPYEKNPKGQPILHHYYDPRLVNFSTPIHNFDREYKFLQSLHEKGNLTLVVDPCRVKR